MTGTVQFRIRFHKGDEVAFGPGKVALIEAIANTGSITAAAKSLGMSYRRAWLLVDEINRSFKQPLISSATGGRSGGGTHVTELGMDVARRYRAIEKVAAQAAKDDIRTIMRRLAG